MNCFVKTWRHSANISAVARLSYLSVDGIVWPGMSLELETDPNVKDIPASYQIAFKSSSFNYQSILLEDVEEVIRFCGHALTSLKLCFKSGAGFTPEIIESIKKIKGLKMLFIASDPYGLQKNHPKLIEDLLNVTNELQSLSLDIGSIRPLRLNREALPSLQHLAAACDTNDLNAITDFCENHGHNIKCLEYLAHPGCDRASEVILALRDLLEILFVQSVPNLLPAEISRLSFPKLKVIRSISSPVENPSLAWLQLDILANVQVYITDYWCSHKYWRKGLKGLKMESLIKPVDFEHIVFITGHEPGVEEKRVLAEVFRRHHIHCHFKSCLDYIELMVSPPLANFEMSLQSELVEKQWPFFWPISKRGSK
ncbi:uncharacterized protein MELLADRAFT_112594 [Melampsora larici-populina 98AG31]|uniref:F-box domain-containing protein n=1 Tax=Melampsora larici-populina (strain 98AG31 / pathotype 3-4-7) TaxID=747676 RepID=F4S6Z6_MELLP|nr:uncharacterized protein MELLADRAFT_112594 [Melampsora larici-populina 98AG31]EGF99595.1 hypothetical protein MELLADRAFT_112594 [Melampsora larici-populina 98AG31]